MPQGCGTWPAAWETDEGDWPNGGEVDIVSTFLANCSVSDNLHARGDGTSYVVSCPLIDIILHILTVHIGLKA